MFELDERVKDHVFWLMVEMLENGTIEESQIKKPLYLSEYKRYKGIV